MRADSIPAKEKVLQEADVGMVGLGSLGLRVRM